MNDPLEAIRRCISVSPFYEEGVTDLIDLIGVDRVLFGSDYPHPEVWPSPPTSPICSDTCPLRRIRQRSWAAASPNCSASDASDNNVRNHESGCGHCHFSLQSFQPAVISAWHHFIIGVSRVSVPRKQITCSDRLSQPGPAPKRTDDGVISPEAMVQDRAESRSTRTILPAALSVTWRPRRPVRRSGRRPVQRAVSGHGDPTGDPSPRIDGRDHRRRVERGGHHQALPRGVVGEAVGGGERRRHAGGAPVADTRVRVVTRQSRCRG